MRRDECGIGAEQLSGDRTDRLKNVKAPTLVLHGTADPLVPPKGGKETAAAIPDARLHGSTVDGIRGAGGLIRPVIEPDQVLPFSLSLFALHGVVVDHPGDDPLADPDDD